MSVDIPISSVISLHHFTILAALLIEGERDGVEGSRRLPREIAGGTAVRVIGEPRHKGLVVRVVSLSRRPYRGQVVGEIGDEVVLHNGFC